MFWLLLCTFIFHHHLQSCQALGTILHEPSNCIPNLYSPAENAQMTAELINNEYLLIRMAHFGKLSCAILAIPLEDSAHRKQGLTEGLINAAACNKPLKV